MASRTAVKRGRPPKVKTEVIDVPAVVQQKQDSLPATVSVNPQLLIERALAGGNIDTLERVIALREKLKAEYAKEQFFRALSAFQAECPEIVKRQEVRDKQEKGGKLRYRYAPLPVILAATKSILEKHGFSWTITTEQDDKTVSAHCHLHHVEGHTETTSFRVPIDFDSYMSPPQKIASALTYAKRYAFCDATGIMTADQDDDGQGGANLEETLRGSIRERQQATPKGQGDAPQPRSAEGYGKTYITKKAGNCAACGKGIEPGNLVHRHYLLDGSWQEEHVTCPIDSPPYTGLELEADAKGSVT